MANDRQGDDDARDRSRLDALAQKHGGLHPGMTSPDSTQAALRAETGEPDEDAVGNAGAGRGDGPATAGASDALEDVSDLGGDMGGLGGLAGGNDRPS
jgi:hypothetical protein